MRLNIRQVIYAGLLIAISIILERLGAVMVGNSIRLSFGNVPIYIGGILLGPVAGGAVGAVSDLLGYLINSFGGAFIPQIFLASVMRGVIPGLVFFKMKGTNLHVKVLVAIILTEFVAGVILTTWGLSWLFDTPFMVLLPPRLVALVVQVPVYAIVTITLAERLRGFVRIYPLPR
ncbi:folate family ECF transporter S component [Dethiobacter alkaliphilus]|uniref:folate family ECF transporter S component n=1 Tax=Dethiobacter alkaliphilus TaxID=427926 RepID=UPI002226E45E|nr:folate family ECF transporter S component [Dethiobacter alkaliphilus]MCW3489160.1 folate family ECF transporter S component [Dethiobacter alkaliphilus]